MFPRRAIRPGEQTIGFLITHNLAGGRVPRQRPSQFQGQIGQDAAGRRDVPLLDVRHRPPPARDAGKKILEMPPRGRRRKRLDVLLLSVFRIFVQFVKAIAMHRFSVAGRDKIVAVRAGLQRSLVAVKNRRPRIFRVRRITPRPMLPRHLQVAIVKHRVLRVGDVGLARRVHQNSAIRRHALRPAPAQHPARQVEHMHAHVPQNAVAIFHERPPPARMHQAVVGPQRRRPRPHFVIQIFRRR